jgi:DNA polymerase-3 subunit alpha
MAFVTLDDRTGRLELAVFSDLFERYRELLVKDALLVVEGQVSVDEYSGGFKMSAERLYNIDQARAVFASRLEIDVDSGALGGGFIADLKQALAPAVPGSCPVALNYEAHGARAEILLGPEWKVTLSNALLDRLTGLAGAGRVRLIYPDVRRTTPAAETAGRHGRRGNYRPEMTASVA